ncbi:hypothetical protein FRZ06_02925 [Anoxybacterium hadale]|uniref:Uncharacterized protein n=1 Tax=Anoxybacterium hadale TaxID=3408580 RepID=A0ACD1A7P0_9FIRM|nr:hypothetical protein FRZ06_02925 [Clostridiales bacterium]
MKKRKEISRRQFTRATLALILFTCSFALVLEVFNFLNEKNLSEFLISIVVILLAVAFFIIIVITANRKDTNGNEKPLGVIYKSSLSPKELFILLFHKKDCPYCGLKLKRKKGITKMNEGIEKISHTYLYGDVYNKKIFFRCEDCNKNFDINELELRWVVSKQKKFDKRVSK